MKTIGAVVFPQFEPLDLYGPLEIFGRMPEDFAIRVLAEAAGPVTSNPGLETLALALAETASVDILLVPGGWGTRGEVENPALLGEIARLAEGAELVLGVCTGSALLARAGLLDGKRATTNKRAFAWASAQGPRTEWVAEARWVEDGRVVTSAGVSAGMDMALAVIARLHGAARAEAIAEEIEYEWHRDPGRDPFAAANGLV